MRYLSLFSGIGGFELGIQKAYEENNSKKSKKGNKIYGYSTGNPVKSKFKSVPICIGYSEINKYAIQIYEKHFSKHKNYGDIKKISAESLPDFDLLVGGFPCQAFSIAGKRRGFDDTRGTLFFDIARILKAKRPRNFILENVKGLLSHDNGRTFKTIIATLVELGYCVEWQVLNAKNFGVPQNRERVFIVGHLGGIPKRKVFPVGESHGHCNEGSGERENSATMDTKGGRNARGTFIATTLGATYAKGDNRPNNKSGRTRIEESNRIRRLTPLECERIMGYPDGWTEGLSDTQKYKCLGNGIVSNVVAEVVKKLL